MKASESASLAGREWKALSAADKKVCFSHSTPPWMKVNTDDNLQPFEEAADQDKQRYDQEKKTVYKN